MDTSFDQFAGGGWGDQGEQDFMSIQGKNLSAYNRIPLPISIEELANLTPSDLDDDKYVIGVYKFNTVRIMGQVATVHTEPNQTVTYEFCDAFAKDQRTAKRLTVVHFAGTADVPQIHLQKFMEGETVSVLGKIRLFNNRISVLALDIHEATSEDVEIYSLECQLAKLYFEKNLPENMQGLENSVFKGLKTPEQLQQQQRPQQPSRSGTSMAGTPSTQGGYGYSNTPSRQGGMQNTNTAPVTPIRRAQPQQHNQIIGGGDADDMQAFEPELNYQPPPPDAGLSGQKKAIFNFVQRIHQGGQGGPGVHIDQIRKGVNANARFDEDLLSLQNDGKIYTTLDDDHYATV